MGEVWRQVTVADIAAPSRNAIVGGPFGSNLVSRDYTSSGVPVIRGQNMGERWISGQFVYVSEKKAATLEANWACPGDVIFTQRGTLGQVSLVPEGRYDRYIISQSQMKLTVNTAIADPMFIYYLFSCSEQKEYFRQNAIQTGVPHINLGILRDTPVLLPPLPEQRAIAHILGTLDDKIELNQRMCETLEAMARALFKSWFVDFDPVRAKAEGCDPGLPEHIADLFPTSFQDSELGEIPMGWEVRYVEDVATCVGGSTPSTKEPKFWDGGTIHWSTPKDLSSLTAPVLLDTARKITEEGLGRISSGLLPAGTLLLSSRAPVGYLAISYIPVAVNQGYIAIPPSGQVSPIWMLFWCEANMNRIKARAGGTTFQEISKRNFRSLKLVVPPKEIIHRYMETVGPIFDRIVSNEREARVLVETRNTLLPRLISGELRVKDAERFIERTMS